ncbi:GTP-binding protein TrmE N-terminus domain containing protein [Naviculisporaceae sp. PSN 640]
MFRHALRRLVRNPSRFSRVQHLTRQIQPCFQFPLAHSRQSDVRRILGHDGSSHFHTSSQRSISSDSDTIYALSSAAGKAGIAVIRVSGPECVDVYNGLCPTKPLPKPRYAAVRTLTEPGRAPESGENIVDSDALVLYFPGPKTVTGEDVLELHVHGGSATVKAVLGAIPKCPSKAGGRIRYAEPGEFTKRAFFNDRLDLAQVEALGDTLAAETEQQRRAAIRGNSGVLGKTYESWREQLLLARGEIEALIDFSEDQHFDESPAELLSNVATLVEGILRSIHLHEMGSQRSELLRNGIRIALLGPPNVGKSSLMNLIVGREASIVSSEAGTTRDIVEASLDIRGYLCSFADTAGIRTRSSASESSGEAGPKGDSVIGAIEEEGIRRARKKALDSDVIIVLASVEPATTTTQPGSPSESESKTGQQVRQHQHGPFYINYDMDTLKLAAGAPQCLVAINKSDSVPPEVFTRLVQDFQSSVLASVPNLHVAQPLTLSCRAAELASAGSNAVGLTGGDADDAGGIHSLTESLVQSFASLTSLPNNMQHLLGVTERQNQLLLECRQHLEDFMEEAKTARVAARRTAGSVASDQDDRPDYASSQWAGDEEPDIVLAAEHLRLAAIQLAAITGRGEGGDVEDVLGVIFEK